MHIRTRKLLLFLGLVLSVDARFASDCSIPQSRPDNESYTRICLPVREVNRTFGISTQPPLASSLNSRPWARYAILQLLAHFESESQRIRLLLENPPPPCYFPATFACNLVSKDIPHAKVNRTVSEVGFGIFGTRKCATEIGTDRERTPVSAIHVYLRELQSVGLKAAHVARLNWKRAHLYQTYTYEDSFDKCQLTRIAAVRVYGKWAIHTAITNHEQSAYKQLGRRENLIEYLHLGKSGKLEALPMVLQSRVSVNGRGEGEASPWLRNASTLLEVRGGVQGTSLFDERAIPADNSAILGAIWIRKHQRQQAHAYTRPSQISILLLPIITSLIPVSMFTDLNSPVIYIYTVSKDIVSALPMVIKGLELISFGKGIKPQATRTRIFGGITEADLAVAETWFAVCNANERVVLLGQTLVIVAVVFTAAGIVIERVSMALSHSRRAMKVANRITGNDCHMWVVAESCCPDCGCFIAREKDPMQKSARNVNVEVFDSFM